MNRYYLISYAEGFASFLLKSKIANEIKEIILFGSVARGEFDKDSDIDIFIDAEDESKIGEIKKAVDIELRNFLDSKLSELWKYRGIRNGISCKVGILEKWELERSVISDGITLYGKYKKLPKGLKQFSLFYFEPIKNVTKRNKIVRILFGRTENSYKYNGLIQRADGKTLSSRSFIVPAKNTDEVIQILDRERIEYKISEIWSDTI